MKHVAKFASIITISWQINGFEKILTGPGKLLGVSRNGPLKDGAFVVLDSKEGIFAMPPARGEPIRQKEESRPYDIGLAFKNMISLSGQDKLRFLENVCKPTELSEFPASVDNGKSRKFNLPWLKRFPLLVNSKYLDGAFCLLCVYFGVECGRNSHRLDKLFTSSITLWTIF